jgi:hypothetical protein
MKLEAGETVIEVLFFGEWCEVSRSLRTTLETYRCVQTRNRQRDVVREWRDGKLVRGNPK